MPFIYLGISVIIELRVFFVLLFLGIFIIQMSEGIPVCSNEEKNSKMQREFYFVSLTSRTYFGLPFDSKVDKKESFIFYLTQNSFKYKYFKK